MTTGPSTRLHSRAQENNYTASDTATRQCFIRAAGTEVDGDDDDGDNNVRGKGRGTHGDWSEKARERSHLEDLDTDGRIVLKCIKKWGRGVDWIDLAQVRT